MNAISASTSEMTEQNRGNGSQQATDRYVTFCGIDCDLKAEQLMAMLEKNISAGKGDARWHSYFTQKREQQAKLQHDNLNFIGHQTNTLYEYFELCQDQEARELLYQIEQECC